MIRRPPRSTLDRSSAASDVYKRQVLEGGSIDYNGFGTIITTEECLMDSETQVRNNGFTKSDYEKVFGKYLGATNVIWLNKGITGDDTHGHVDDITRFVNKNTVVTAMEIHPNDPNYLPLMENRELLEDAKLEDGSNLEIVELPMPSPVVFKGERLPASYANFYIANNTVLVPTFNDVNDKVALCILSELFEDRKVIGIHAVDLVWGLGTLHCFCLLYTSDAADERSSVDLGGRRIIKKKKINELN